MLWASIVQYVCGLLGYVSGSNSFLKPLAAAEEAELLARAAEKDYEARGRLIEHNLRLVAYVAKKYHSTNIDKDDLISIGAIGLIKGIDSYKGGMGTKLGTYLMRCIENEILMVLRVQKKVQNETSLNEPIGYDAEGKQISLIDILSDDSRDIVDEVGAKLEISKLYEKMRERLDEREKQVVVMRYGLGGGMELTQKQIAKVMGISRSYVSRIETKAVRKLRE